MKKIILSFGALVCLSLFPTISHAKTGQTRLEILPLEEELPRIYAVNDLDFGRQKVTAGKTGLHPQNDSVIELLDARVTSQAWELQVKLSDVQKNDKQALTAATLTLGQGEISGDTTTGITTHTIKNNFATNEFQTMLSSKSTTKRGTIIYTIPKKAITLTFSQKNVAGNYQATNYWRFINAAN